MLFHLATLAKYRPDLFRDIIRIFLRMKRNKLYNRHYILCIISYIDRDISIIFLGESVFIHTLIIRRTGFHHVQI